MAFNYEESELDNVIVEATCVCCGEVKSSEEMQSGHDMCFDCFSEHQE